VARSGVARTDSKSCQRQSMRASTRRCAEWDGGEGCHAQGLAQGEKEEEGEEGVVDPLAKSPPDRALKARAGRGPTERRKPQRRPQAPEEDPVSQGRGDGRTCRERATELAP